mmetsp:Transcript_19062/g.37452  ORF Transcript_19062/g.37452 Transcript_19062/m.37452 type:complete len:348 (+) Transcript_19062:87-1130(+)
MVCRAGSKSRRGAVVVGALCIGLLVRGWHPPIGCFVTAPGGRHQRHQKRTERLLHSMGSTVDTAPSDSVEKELGELKLATEPNDTSINHNVWDSWLATPWLPDVTDAALASLGAGLGLVFVSFLDGISPVKLYAAPLAASSILIFANIRPPSVQNVLIGTAGPAAGSVLCSSILSQFLPSVVTRSVSVATSLIFFKFTGFFFPPAAAIAALGVENEAFAKLSWSYVIFPAVTGNAILYGLALLLSGAREKIRAALTARQWRMGTRDEALIKEIFDRCDLDRSGTVDIDELNVAMRYLVGKDVSYGEAAELMAKVDSDGDGILDFGEFTTVIETYQGMQAFKRSHETA